MLPVPAEVGFPCVVRTEHLPTGFPVASGCAEPCPPGRCSGPRGGHVLQEDRGPQLARVVADRARA